MRTRVFETATLLEVVRDSSDYNRETGSLTWKSRPSSHFNSEHARVTFNGRFSGRVAGSAKPNGYIEISLFLKEERIRLYAHRVAFALSKGAWPVGEVDHIDGLRGHNSAVNLREATSVQNKQNGIWPNATGLTGAHIDKRRAKPWSSCINVDKKKHYLGSFDTPEEAHAAYLEAKSNMHTFNPVPRSAT